MNRFLRWIFTLCIAYPVVWIWLGIRVSGRKKLPVEGPAIIVANHNSHLDVLTLFTLFPLSTLVNVQPVAAADYFLRNKVIGWFALKVIGIIPVFRGADQANPLQACVDALAAKKIVIIFPEGTRGEPGKFAEIKSGIWHLSQQCPEVPIIPVYMHGLDRSMGKGQKIPVPFFIDIFIDEPLFYDADKVTFKQSLFTRFVTLQQQATRKIT
ncbi:lysophospholipid acyltransferase family protein [Enterobacter roggenkampii]|jgi:1-acyl-sn-glycerol-3-phosphate acyltransferase|uniref:lysophospholipid acyltransferase family protein n=1 Tax=Enterobacter roggenkampii TaxID=1812935 RepID=UPI000CC9F820|nr:lysophospholipid acyltransferase family protein [Enterobacter roggenkampii]GBE68891.1 acyltransferase family protein [Enterobacter sp. KINAN-G]EHN8805283.1 1-acyl-sn-glycerol-3-phosphate acyltransferase [Enterobacter roggenkampii]ELT5303099.1 1-acyl-sn-glycerol-3-phosphate acyltransferase [Enterobacter roggenkampii]EMF1894911.1 1-acyl-sn-glycerol-3-phosphate acyltransferase [Enterobacter roggenkampii]MBA2153450.1 1-acyl-sn-glycerol-3-phosphate acyltransferase [Enterobacter roggenkampii]